MSCMQEGKDVEGGGYMTVQPQPGDARSGGQHLPKISRAGSKKYGDKMTQKGSLRTYIAPALVFQPLQVRLSWWKETFLVRVFE